MSANFYGQFLRLHVEYFQLNIQGPLSRQLMQRLLSSSSSSDDLSNDGFPFRCIREISIGYARVFCARITYVGELGYELFIPAEHGALLTPSSILYRRVIQYSCCPHWIPVFYLVYYVDDFYITLVIQLLVYSMISLLTA